MKIIAFFLPAFLWACAGNQPDTGQKPVEYIYKVKCSLCHGPDGTLQIAGAPDLSKSLLSLDERIEIISKGKGTMPPHAGILDEQQIHALAVYIETLRK
jgi:mono/diheme cytochrome c family protein